MNFRFLTLTLLLATLLGFTDKMSAQIGYQFLLQVPVVDSANGNQWAVGQQFWLEADPGFSGNVNGGGGGVNGNGYLEDSVYVFGPGVGALLLRTVDCHGDTVTTSVPFDSSYTVYVADTIFLCAGSNATCAANFTFNSTPGNPTVSFFGTSTGAGTVTWQSWTFGDGSGGSGANPSHTYTNNGNYYVTYEVAYSTGCTSTHSQFVSVTGGNVVCSTSILASQWGSATNFYVNSTASGTPVSFSWNFGDGQTLNTGTNGIFHSYAASGIYNVCVATTFSDGCLDTTCQSYTITLGGQGNCTAWFSLGVNGQTVTFQDSSTGSSAVQTWWWDFGDGATDSLTGANVSHTYAGQGPYTVRLEIFTADTCYADTSRTVVLQPAACSAGFTHAPDTSGQYTVIAYNTSVGTNLGYSWDFGDGNSSTQAYPIHQYAGAGTYLVCLSVTQPSPACTDTFCSSVIITQKQAMAFTFAVWNPGTAVEEGVTSGGGHLVIAPQPVRNHLRMVVPRQHDGLVGVGIYDARGQLVVDRSVWIGGGRGEMEVSDLPNGVYVVRIGAEVGRFWVLR